MLPRKLKFIVNAGMLMAGFCSLPAMAGPDWAIIRDAHEMSVQRAHEEKVTLSKPVMPLDHGPRAISTPWLNQQMAAHEKDVRAQSKNL